MAAQSDSEFLAAVRARLERGPGAPDDLQPILDATLAHFNCVVGTVHRIASPGGPLELVVARGVPDAIMDRVRSIPIGKGMAGLAAERREPVQVCNLQTDTSGAAKPGAKLTEMEGSIAAPILVHGEVLGAIGVAMPRPHEFTREEADLLLQVGTLIGEAWKRG